MQSHHDSAVSSDRQLKIFELLKQEVLQRRSDVRRLQYEITELHKRMKEMEDQFATEDEPVEEVNDDKLPSVFGLVRNRLATTIESNSKPDPDSSKPELSTYTEEDVVDSTVVQDAVDRLFDSKIEPDQPPEDEACGSVEFEAPSIEEKSEPVEPISLTTLTMYASQNDLHCESHVNDNQPPSKAEPPTLDGLKQKLHEQLKQAEVEMSLERARVFQQKAELEELKIQIQQQKGSSKREQTESRDLDFENRWNRHLEHYRKKQEMHEEVAI